jgi:hypothetical protein
MDNLVRDPLDYETYNGTAMNIRRKTAPQNCEAVWGTNKVNLLLILSQP